MTVPAFDGRAEAGSLRGDGSDGAAGAWRGWAVPPVPGPLRGPALEPESDPPEEEPPDALPPDDSPPPLRLPCAAVGTGSAKVTTTTTDVMSERRVIMAVLRFCA